MMYVILFYLVQMGSVVTLLFAPSFLILQHFFDYKNVVAVYGFLSVLFLVYRWYKSGVSWQLAYPMIFVTLFAVAYTSSSMLIIRFFPVVVSAIFFLMFFDAWISNKSLVLAFTNKFYPKKLSSAEERYLKKSDLYWSIITMLNTLIQLYLTFYQSEWFWALYSSFGWAIFMVLALIIQIVFGRVYALKMSS